MGVVWSSPYAERRPVLRRSASPAPASRGGNGRGAFASALIRRSRWSAVLLGALTPTEQDGIAVDGRARHLHALERVHRRINAA